MIHKQKVIRSSPLSNNSLLPLAVKNDLKIKSKSNIRIDGNIETWVSPENFPGGGPPFPGGGQTLARTSFIRLKPIHIKESSDSRGGGGAPPCPPLMTPMKITFTPLIRSRNT